MKNKYYLSYLACRLSSMTGDHITAAMIFIDKDDTVTIRVSENRLKILDHILEPYLAEWFREIVSSYERAINDGKLNYQLVERASRYQNGILKVFSPTTIAMDSFEGKMEKDEVLEKLFLKNVDTYFYKEENKNKEENENKE